MIRTLAATRSRCTVGAVRGFTLVELLVSLFVVAVMFALGYGALNQALDNRDLVREQQERLGELQGAMRVMLQDFSQLAPRPVRDALGQGDEPAVRADPRTSTLVSLSRGGFGNAAGLPRPTLQRVEYLFVDGRLIRRAWNVMDRTQASEPQDRILLQRVTAVGLRYMDASRRWIDTWPDPASPLTPAQRVQARPIAVELTIETEDYGRILRVFEVPG